MSKLYKVSEALELAELIEENEIKDCARIIQKGGLVAFPTETVYGLGANAFDKDAAKKIYEAKGRPSDNPLIVHISNMEMLKMVVKEVGEDAKRLIDEFFPAPLTLIMKKSDLIPDEITSGLDTVGVRMPKNKIALALIEASGVPIAAPSANVSGRPSPTHYKHVIEDLGGRVDAILCAQDCEIGIESTILDISERDWKILRPGAIGIGDLEKFHERLSYVNFDESQKPKAPGMKYRHYSPNAEVKIVPFDMDEFSFQELIRESSKDCKVYVIDIKNSTTLAKSVFKKFREADESGYDIILVREVCGDDMSEAVMNRIRKAAGHK